MNLTGLWAQYRGELASDPLLVMALSGAVLALATTPLAFALLGRLEWFKARRGRVNQRPEFSSIVASMVLVMGIPVIFAALVIKSRSFDHNRYEFDPNRTWSVLEQGRGFRSLKEADAAVKEEMQRLALERKALVNNIKKLDEAMLALRSVASTSPAVAQRFPAVLQSLAGVRKSVGLDGPQQLSDNTALPVELRAMNAGGAGGSKSVAGALTPGMPPVVNVPHLPASETAAASAAGSNELSPAEVEAELATVPEPQRRIAAMLPLANLSSEWTVGKSGERHLETFNADNLYEKIDGRAESFIQYGVKGMAYSFYHPTGDASAELQLYVFEMGDGLKALGKYGSEKPDEFKPVSIGSEGYTSAGSVAFHAGRYYTQVVSTQDAPKFAGFALVLAERVARLQKPVGVAGPGPAGPSGTRGADAGDRARPSTGDANSPVSAELKTENREAQAKRVIDDAKPQTTEVSPEMFFALLPARGRQGEAKYVAQDVFGYSFLSDVFMADYKDGDVTWQGFIRPYRDTTEAKAMLEKYGAGVKKDGAQVKTLTADGADEMVASANIGLFDVVFRKGNTLAGANGATSAAAAEAFARALAKGLPATVATIPSSNKP
jgi:hypothetical protein